MDDELDEIAKPKGKMGTIAAYVAVLAVGLGGGYGASLVMGHGKAGAAEAHGSVAAEAPAEGEADDSAGHAPEAAAGHGAAPEGHEGAAATPATGSVITSLGQFTVNLRGSGGGRILRMEVQVDTAANSSEAVAARAPQLKDSVLNAVSDYTWAELEGTDGKARLKDELLARVNGVVAPATIDQIYFTQFVVQ